MPTHFTRIAALAVAFSLPIEAGAQEAELGVQAAAGVDAEFARFAPRPDPQSGRIDYAAWTDAMSYLVLPMGRSLRQTPGIPAAGMGTRRVYGHDSRFRLEGNRVMFSFFNEDLKAMVGEYRRELEQTAATVDIASLGRNEQLAFWFNLHNVAMMEQIAKAWPVRQPSTIEIDGVPLDEAKFINVAGVSMSPSDIRTKIVYPNWRDPRVIYGFWRGDIGGPSIPSEAFDGLNLQRLLQRNAGEFVNSLRGVQKRGDRLQVSEIYQEAQPFYFPDWKTDIRAHVTSFAEEDVKELLGQTDGVDAAIYELDIADLAGGVREPSYVLVESDGSAVKTRISPGMARLLRERETKLDRAAKQPRTGTVTFTPIDLPGQEGKSEVE